MSDGLKIALLIIGALLLIVLLIFIDPLIFMWCWNLALCAVFPVVPTITFWQSFGICILLNLIGGCFGKRVVVKKND